MCGSCIMQDHILGEAEKYEILTFSTLPSYCVASHVFCISDHHSAVSVIMFRVCLVMQVIPFTWLARLGFVVLLSNTFRLATVTVRGFSCNSQPNIN